MKRNQNIHYCNGYGQVFITEAEHYLSEIVVSTRVLHATSWHANLVHIWIDTCCNVEWLDTMVPIIFVVLGNLWSVTSKWKKNSLIFLSRPCLECEISLVWAHFFTTTVFVIKLWFLFISKKKEEFYLNQRWKMLNQRWKMKDERCCY